MNLESVGEIIATRELQVTGSGKVIEVRLGRPEKFSDSDDYYCRYQIMGLGRDRVFYGAGVDQMQALVLALQNIGAELYTSNEARAGQLTWFGELNLGFPVADTIADLVPKRAG
jgi:hypothetical protein